MAGWAGGGGEGVDERTRVRRNKRGKYRVMAGI